MDKYKTKAPVYLYMGCCLVVLALSLLMILWVKNNSQIATRLVAEELVENGMGYELSVNEADETYVLGNYTTRISTEGITLLSAHGEERQHYDTGLIDPYVLQDGEMLVVASDENHDLFVLDRNGGSFKLSVDGETISVYAKNEQLLLLAKQADGSSVVNLVDLKTNETIEINRFEAGQEPMRARLSPDGLYIDVLVMPIYSGETRPYLLRLSRQADVVAMIDLVTDDLFVDFIYRSDGSIAFLAASTVVVTDSHVGSILHQVHVNQAAGLWNVSGRLIILAGSETDGYALYTIDEAREDGVRLLLHLEDKPVIMPAISDTYGVIVTDRSLQLIDLRGVRLLDTYPLVQKVCRVEFTGPTSFIVIADRGVYPFAVQ